MNLLHRLLREEDGPTAVEYAVMLSLIIMVCVGAVQLVGQTTQSSFADSRDQIAAAMGGGGS
jgi:pilus assembly protein Flp/PilA